MGTGTLPGKQKKNRQRQGNNTPVRDIHKAIRVQSKRCAQPGSHTAVKAIFGRWGCTQYGTPSSQIRARKDGVAGAGGRGGGQRWRRREGEMGWVGTCVVSFCLCGLGGLVLQEPPPRCPTPALAGAAHVALTRGLVRKDPSPPTSDPLPLPRSRSTSDSLSAPVKVP